MSLMRGVTAFFLAALALASPIGSGVASACTAPTAPLAVVAAQATVIVMGRITGHQPVAGSPDKWTIGVDNVLKGTAPAELHVSNGRVSACGDDIDGRVGWQIIFARGIPFGHEPALDAYWAFDTSGILLEGTDTRGFTIGTDTIETVAKVLKDALPDTSIAVAASPDSQTPGSPFGFITLAAGILLGALLNRRTRRAWSH